VFPGVVEAEKRVDYLYQALTRLEAVGQAEGVADSLTTVPARIPKELAPFGAIASDAPDKVTAALDEDLNTPVALAVLAELAKAANELADLGVKRRKDAELQRALPFVAARVFGAIGKAIGALGLLQTPAATYRERTQRQRLDLLGLTPLAVDAKLAERTAARQAKEFARGDALRGELEAQGIEVADTPEGSTWRVAPGGRHAPSKPA
jgi:cysteinyl-tRNA synthetase